MTSPPPTLPHQYPQWLHDMTSRAESCPPHLSVKAANAITSRSPAVANAAVIQPNAAFRGAALAFAARPTNVKTNPTGPNSSNGATAAAAAAGIRSHTKPIPVPYKASQSVKPKPAPVVLRPISVKSPSQLAAKAASASSSPQKSSVFLETPTEPTTTYATNHNAQIVGSGLRTHKNETAEKPRGRRLRVEDIAAPQPIQTLSSQSALAAILARERGVSPGSTLQGGPVYAAQSELSAGLSAARAAAKSVEPVTPLADLVRNPVDGSTRTKQADDAHSLILQPQEDHASTAAAFAASTSVQTAVERGSAEAGSKSEDLSILTSSVPSSYSTTGQINSGGSPNSHLRDHSMSMAEWAWSAASSRAPSPAKVAPPPTTRQRSHSHSLFHRQHSHQRHESSRPNGPVHVLKHTLRKQKSDDEEDENGITKRGRRHFIRKHQHKHHEGDRKRWRDKITERERKRYEGVWAANKGLYTFWDFSKMSWEEAAKPSAEKDLVLNVVVREIWDRSRLPSDILEEVWSLVADENAAILRREQFVVGMWLIDQRLKGRKLPIKVSVSVWASARHTLKIRAKP